MNKIEVLIWDISDRIFALLKEKNATAKSFAEYIGVSTGNVSDWKSRKSKPSIDKLPQIAEFFDISVDCLLGIEKSLESPDYIHDYCPFIATKCNSNCIFYDDLIYQCKLPFSLQRQPSFELNQMIQLLQGINEKLDLITSSHVSKN